MGVDKHDNRRHQLQDKSNIQRALTGSNVKFIHPIILSFLLSLSSIGIIAGREVVLLDCFLININLHALDSLLQINIPILILTLFGAVAFSHSRIRVAAGKAGFLVLGVFAVAVLANFLALILSGSHLCLHDSVNKVRKINDVVCTVLAEGARVGGTELEMNELLGVHALVVFALCIVVVIPLVGVLILAVVSEVSTVVVDG